MTSPQESPALWAVVPAAGIGSRMQSEVPKQYLPINGRTVLETTLLRLLRIQSLKGIMVVLSPDDDYFADLPLHRLFTREAPKVLTALGGAERANSVLNGLKALRLQGAKTSDWVLVHDAARPCVKPSSLEKLIATIRKIERSISVNSGSNGSSQECSELDDSKRKKIGGALLAAPVADTLKQAESDRHVLKTVPRQNIWQAHTPQCFQLGELTEALSQALSEQAIITDEASAIEYVGGQVMLVEDTRDNIKITQPEDLALAAFILAEQEQNR